MSNNPTTTKSSPNGTREVWAAASQLASQRKRITIRKLMGMTGIRATASVSYHLAKLEAAGYITKPRGFRKTEADWVVNVPLIDCSKDYLVKEEA